MQPIKTRGVHHIGLSVSRLEDSARFFVELLDFSEVRRVPEYPAIFVSDGTTLITLWQVRDPAACRDFDKHTQVGLHHLALQVASEDDLYALYARLQQANVPIEFAPEWLRGGPAKHLMCFEPSGIRIELIFPG